MEESDDMMKILIATDNHIGYMEKDPIRCSDSLEAFEEVLKIAKDQDVDFILLGGDLFHENKPSRQVLHRTMELLRHYCMGSRPCPIELRSDPSVNFQHSKFPIVNYEDPNYNVSIPVFMIHGNHDDPAGDGNLSAVDILDVSNFINYFGKATDIEKIELSPVLLQKGDTKLALYGLGSCRDERLHRMFRKGKVKFSVSSTEEGDWFNLLVLHQNRAKHGATNYIPASFIPDFFDLVFWGHEHECLIEPQYVPTGGETEDGKERGVYITQPGSSVATSLSDGEQKQKHVGILYIKSDLTFKIDPIPLQSVRPFIIESIHLKDTGIHPQDEASVEKYLAEKVASMIDRAAAEYEGNDKLPLVRLKVDYNGGFTSFSWARFGQQFNEKVANPKNILLWYRHRDPNAGGTKKKEEGKDMNGFSSLGEASYTDQLDVSILLQEELKKENLGLLSEKNLVEALSEFVDKQENEALSECVKFSLQKCQEFLRSRPSSSDKDIDKQIDEHKEQLCELQETEGAEAFKESMSAKRQKRLEGEDDMPDPAASGDSDDDSVVKEKPKAATGTTRGGRGSRGGRGRGSRGGARGRGSTRGTGGGGGRGRGSRGRKNGEGSSTSTATATLVTPSAIPGVAVSPSLSFSSTGASKRSRLTGKRPMSYLDDDPDEGGGEGVSFSGFGKSSKKAKSADTTFDMVDLTQSDDDDDDFMESSSTGAAAAATPTHVPSSAKINPFHSMSAKTTARRKKK